MCACVRNGRTCFWKLCLKRSKSQFNKAFQALWVEIHQTNVANIICGVLYRQHNSPEQFLKYFEEAAEDLNATGKPVYVMTDANINLLHFNSCNYAQDFLLTLQNLNSAPCIDKPTRVHRNLSH